jgi:hypothetical protein
MDFDIRHFTGIIVIASGAAVLGLSYLGAYLLGRNAGRNEAERRDALPAAHEPDRLDRIEAAVDSISLQVERLGEGQRYLLGAREAARPERRHATPV